MQLAAVTDEISLDLAEAVRLGTEIGIHAFELRSLYSPSLGRVVRCGALPAADLPYVREAFARYGARLIGLSPGLFKVVMGSPEFEAHRTELLPRCLDLAEVLTVRQMVIFSPLRPQGSGPGPIPPEGAEALAEAARLAGRRGLTLLLENEHVCYADSGERTSALLHDLGQPALRCNWDPGNAHAAGEAPYPRGYRTVRQWVGEVHLKDSRRTAQGGQEWALLGEGEIDWAGQLKALAEDGYAGYLTLEPHLGGGAEAMRRSYEALRRQAT